MVEREVLDLGILRPESFVGPKRNPVMSGERLGGGQMRCSVKTIEDFDRGSGLDLNIEPTAGTPGAAEAASERESLSGSGFYFSFDDLRSRGYDDGLSKFLVWAIHAAQRTAHGDVKEIGRVLHFNNLTRAYKYIKLARALELGQREAAMKINKTHTIRRRAEAR